MLRGSQQPCGRTYRGLHPLLFSPPPSPRGALVHSVFPPHAEPPADALSQLKPASRRVPFLVRSGAGDEPDARAERQRDRHRPRHAQGEDVAAAGQAQVGPPRGGGQADTTTGSGQGCMAAEAAAWRACATMVGTSSPLPLPPLACMAAA
jgi:hypothetical protein